MKVYSLYLISGVTVCQPIITEFYFTCHFALQINTFQCVLATSAPASFVIFLYADGEIQWTNGALAGINAGDGVNSITIPGSRTQDIINISQTSNVGIPGIWMFQVNGGNVHA